MMVFADSVLNKLPFLLTLANSAFLVSGFLFDVWVGVSVFPRSSCECMVMVRESKISAGIYW